MVLFRIMNMTLRECIAQSMHKNRAVGHFNISNIEGLHAIFNAAKKLNVPVIIGVSEGERDFVGVEECRALVTALREKHNFPIYLNADHTYSFERVKEAIDAGFDAVIIDGAKLPFDKNVEIACKAVEYAAHIKSTTGREVLVEGELGYIGTSSKILDKVPEGVGLDPASLTSPEDAKKFVQSTGVDLFAPAVGNIHGMIKNAPNPRLNISRIQELTAKTGVPLVLHGASGISTDDLQAAVQAGIGIVHYNTELRVAYKDALKKTLTEHPDEVAPYRLLQPSIDAMQAVVEEKLRIMNNL